MNQNLAVLQSALARLYTDAALRERFVANPVARGAEIGLDAATSQKLARTTFAQVTHFARSLQLKRLGEAAGYLPGTRRTLGRDFVRCFLRYAATPPPIASNRPMADALRFTDFLAAECAGGALQPAWISDLARCETAWCSVQARQSRVLIRRFRFRVDALLAAEGTASQSEIEPVQQNFIGIWWCWRGSIRVKRFAMPTLPRPNVVQANPIT